MTGLVVNLHTTANLLTYKNFLTKFRWDHSRLTKLLQKLKGILFESNLLILHLSVFVSVAIFLAVILHCQ